MFKKLYFYIIFLKSLFSLNNKNSLEFQLGRDKRFLKLADTYLTLDLEIPDNYWPDNDVFQKLFENVEISIAYELGMSLFRILPEIEFLI